MTDEFKVLILPAQLNNTPHNEDMILLVTREEFMKMWRRGQAMIRNRKLKGKGIDEDFRTGIEIC